MVTTTIGRSPDNQIVIDDMMISRMHAKIEIDDTRIFITDLSKNGTYVNGQRLFANLRKQILRDDKVNFAQVSDLDWSQIPQLINNGTIINHRLPPILNGGNQGQPVHFQNQPNYESLDFLKIAVSFIMPIYGIILYFIYLNAAPKKSSQAITAALIGLAVGVFLLITKN